jgi:chromosome segregation ATPase
MIESTKRKLVLEQKVKQAAQSLNRLENAASKRQRISATASTHLDTAQRKCDEINAELWRLSSLSMDIERKLLNHNVAVLGLGMSILERKAMENGMTDEFGEGHLYLSNNETEETSPKRFSILEKPTVPSAELTEAQNRLRELNVQVASASRSEVSPSDDLLSYIDQLERNIPGMIDSHATVTRDLQASLSESQRMIEQLKLRERDQSAGIVDATKRIEDLQRRLTHTQEEFDRVQNEIDDQDAVVEHLKQELETAKEEAKIAENAAKGREAESIRRERSRQRDEAERFTDQLVEKDDTIANLSKEVEDLREQHQSAQDLQSKFDEQSSQHDITVRDLETQLVMLKSETAMLKAERDEILGSRQQRAEEARLQRELEEQREKFAQNSQSQDILLQELETLKKRNSQLTRDLELSESERSATADSLTRQIVTLEKQLSEPAVVDLSDASREKGLESRCDELQSELTSILDDFERLTAQFIDHESFRQALEAQVDGLREQCHVLQTELAEERVKLLGRHSDTSSPVSGGSGNAEQTSTLTLRNEFRKMVAQLRNEHIAKLKVDISSRCC